MKENIVLILRKCDYPKNQKQKNRVLNSRDKLNKTVEGQ